MANFLGRDPHLTFPAWPEWQMQAYTVMELRRMGWIVAADQNQGVRNSARAKAEGIQAGEPDLRVYRAGGGICLIELKKKGGRVSPAQKSHHEALAMIGHPVAVIWADSPAAMLAQVLAVLNQSV